MASEFTKRIYEVVRQIPRGCVASYGQVAFLAGNPRGARGVGFAMHRSPEPGGIPCHRVVFKDGACAAALPLAARAYSAHCWRKKAWFSCRTAA